MEVDFREFQRAVDRYAAETGKTCADSLNRAMVGVLYKSRSSVIRLTPKTSETKILRSLTKRGDMFERLAAKNLAKRGAPGGAEAVADEMGRIFRRRKSAVGYNKSGWAPAARDFGASRIKAPFAGSVASDGESKTATAKSLEAYALNAVGAGLKNGETRRKTYAAVQRAVNAQTKDMLGYLNRRMVKLGNKYRGK